MPLLKKERVRSQPALQKVTRPDDVISKRILLKGALFIKIHLYPYKEFVMSFDLIIKNGTVILKMKFVLLILPYRQEKSPPLARTQGRQSRSWMRRVWWFHTRAWLDAHTHISLSRAVRTGKAMRPNACRGKGGITTMIEMSQTKLPATVDRETIELKFDAAKAS